MMPNTAEKKKQTVNKVCNVQKTLGLSPNEAEGIMWSGNIGASLDATKKSLKHAKIRPGEEERASRIARLHTLSRQQRDRMRRHLDRYCSNVRKVKNLMSALLKSNIKHDQRARFYQTLHRISSVLDRHFSLLRNLGEPARENS